MSHGERHGLGCPQTFAHRSAISRSPRKLVGAYYFDGWAGARDGFHFAGLLSGPYSNRMPLYGWSDRSPATMRQQLRWARSYGISFFVFDWYFAASASHDPYLNQALLNYESLRNHDSVGSALLYVNTPGRAGQDDFVIPRSRWRATIEDWVTRDFLQSDYLRIAGKPVLFILDAFALRDQLGGDRGLDKAFALLDRTARQHGFPGVFVVGGVYVEHGFDWHRLSDLVGAQHYDALTQYSYPAAPPAPARAGERSYGQVITSEEQIWDRFARTSGIPYIPDVMAGWDPRPWNERVDGRLFWYRRTPSLFGKFVRDALQWSDRTPGAAVAGVRGPLILIEAWNELGEGSYIVPTIGTCHRYGRALANALHR